MAYPNCTAPHNVVNIFTGAPLAQRFIDDPALYALACAEGCADMTDAELADMDEMAEYQMYLATAY